MTLLRYVILAAALFTLLSPLTACSPDVGSKQWCEEMKEKPKKEWTSQEMKDYARHCLFK